MNINNFTIKISSVYFDEIIKTVKKIDFVPVGMAPTKYKCMTMYQPSISHTPFIEDKITFRWSHTFCCFDKGYYYER